MGKDLRVTLTYWERSPDETQKDNKDLIQLYVNDSFQESVILAKDLKP